MEPRRRPVAVERRPVHGDDRGPTHPAHRRRDRRHPKGAGIGLGHRFIDLREAHARALGRTHVAFCSVIRSGDHPARPAIARTNDAFWRGRGYRTLPGVVARFSWKDLGDTVETEKPLQFWMREL